MEIPDLKALKEEYRETEKEKYSRPWRQAHLCYQISEYYGFEALTQLAEEMGLRSAAFLYKLARIYWRYVVEGNAYSWVKTSLDEGYPKMSHFRVLLRSEKPDYWLEKAYTGRIPPHKIHAMYMEEEGQYLNEVEMTEEWKEVMAELEADNEG